MMKKIIFMLALFTLVSCSPGNNVDPESEITNLLQLHEEVVDLDAKYNTSYRKEMVNLILIDSNSINNYLNELDTLYLRSEPETENQGRWMSWFYEARKQMLESQLIFQKAILDIGNEGRAMDGFRCSEFTQIEEFTLLVDRSWSLGVNSTRIFDSLLTESQDAQELIGLGDNKPRIYSSDFDGMYNEVHDNVFAMENQCDKRIETKYLEFDLNSTNNNNLGGEINGT